MDGREPTLRERHRPLRTATCYLGCSGTQVAGLKSFEGRSSRHWTVRRGRQDRCTREMCGQVLDPMPAFGRLYECSVSTCELRANRRDERLVDTAQRGKRIASAVCGDRDQLQCQPAFERCALVGRQCGQCLSSSLVPAGSSEAARMLAAIEYAREGLLRQSQWPVHCRFWVPHGRILHHGPTSSFRSATSTSTARGCCVGSRGRLRGPCVRSHRHLIAMCRWHPVLPGSRAARSVRGRQPALNPAAVSAIEISLGEPG